MFGLGAEDKMIISLICGGVATTHADLWEEPSKSKCRFSILLSKKELARKRLKQKLVWIMVNESDDDKSDNHIGYIDGENDDNNNYHDHETEDLEIRDMDLEKKNFF
ncbi:4422_t:CDS:2 [Entrophospora sp. SA101]|nr:4422_t:CDS:2 [Entrophospora sp. SA101]